MRRFSFKLEKILELRRYAEREWEQKLAEVTGRVVAAEDELRNWARRRAATRLVQGGPGALDMDLLRSRDDYLSLIDQRVAQLENRLAALEVEREKVRQDYIKVSRKRKALTKLKERRSAEYYSDALREQGRELDEIGSVQAVRRISRMEDAAWNAERNAERNAVGRTVGEADV